ncbi:hypothetical protein BDR04DRAFT_257923 [Suillus decipiens]|nr:hypothetical protein BDR04DRAFT_257923 [Suillus decipiens]
MFLLYCAGSKPVEFTATGLAWWLLQEQNQNLFLRFETCRPRGFLALKTRYNKLDVRVDLNEAIDLYRESLRLADPEHHVNLHNLSSVLCSRFTETQENENVLFVEDHWRLSSLHPHRYFSYMSRYRILLMQHHYRCDVRRTPSRSFTLYRSRRSQDSQRSLHQGNRRRISDEPGGVEDGSNKI